jgi:hypothetical protein
MVYCIPTNRHKDVGQTDKKSNREKASLKIEEHFVWWCVVFRETGYTQCGGEKLTSPNQTLTY